MQVQPSEPTFSRSKREQLCHSTSALILDAIFCDKPRGRQITSSILERLKQDAVANQFFPIVRPMPTKPALAVKKKRRRHTRSIVTEKPAAPESWRASRPSS